MGKLGSRDAWLASGASSGRGIPALLALLLLMLPLQGCDEVSRARIGARFGSADAQTELGLRYELGDGVEANPQRAASYYRGGRETQVGAGPRRV